MHAYFHGYSKYYSEIKQIYLFQFYPSIQLCWTLLLNELNKPYGLFPLEAITPAEDLATTKFDQNRFLLPDSLG